MKCAFIDLGKHFGGAENYLITIIDRWKSQGNDVLIIVKKDTSFEAKVKELYPIEEIESVNYSLSDVKRIRKIFIKSHTDIVHINGINSGVFFNVVNINIPRITTVHSNAYMDRVNKNMFIRNAFVIAENNCLKKSNKIIVVSEALEKVLLERKVDNKKINVIHNGVSIVDYQNKKLRKDKTDILKICFVGRLETVKGCEYLIKAIGELNDLNIQCDIYGDGSLKHELINLRDKLGLHNRIVFKGFSKDIRNLLSSYDVMVLPSLFEAFPLTIPEAMNSKTIVVCSNTGGMPWIINEHRNGYIFEKESFKGLAKKLKYIYENPKIQIQIIENAYDDFLNFYTEEIMLNRTLTLIKHVLDDE